MKRKEQAVDIDFEPAGNGWRVIVRKGVLPPVLLGTAEDMHDGRWRIITETIELDDEEVPGAEIMMPAKNLDDVREQLRMRAHVIDASANRIRAPVMSELVCATIGNLESLARQCNATAGFLDGMTQGLGGFMARAVQGDKIEEFLESLSDFLRRACAHAQKEEAAKEELTGAFAEAMRRSAKRPGSKLN